MTSDNRNTYVEELQETVILSAMELGHIHCKSVEMLVQVTNVQDRRRLISNLSQAVRALAKTKDKPVPTNMELVSIHTQHQCNSQDTLYLFFFQRKAK